MTVKPGSDWGERVGLPGDAVVLGSDAALAASVSAGERRPLVVWDGDLHRTLGAPAPGDTVSLLPVDLLRVVTDRGERLAAAHVVARRPGRLGWWRGPLVAVMNAEYVGRWDVAPRAHPNDGRADVVEVAPEMSLRERWQAWRRLPSGTHVPHPGVSVRRVAAERFEWPRALTVWVDGVEVGRTRTVQVTVLPDAATIHV